jgi:hypothetical protein
VQPSTVNFSQDLVFITKNINDVTFVYDATTIYTLTGLTVTLVPGFQIEAQSKIEVNVPPLITGTSYLQPTTSCTSVSNIAAGITCAVSGNKLIVDGGFPTAAATGTQIKFKINNIYTPLSTSTYFDFTAYFQKSSGVRYMKWLTGSVKVTAPKQISSLNYNIDDDSVGADNILVIGVTPSGFVYDDFWIEILSDGVVDFTTSTAGSGVLKSAVTPDRIAIGPNSFWKLNSGIVTNIYINSVKNRKWAQNGFLSVKIYDKDNNIAQDSALVPMTLKAPVTNPGSISLSSTVLGSATTVTY